MHTTFCFVVLSRYAHNDAELRWTPEFYKTSLCSFWQSGKHCPAGQLCRWAHGAQELRHRKQWQHSRLASIPERQLRDAKTASQIAETTKDATKSALAPFWKLTGKNACQRQRSPTHELGAHTWSPPRVRNERLRHHDAVTKGITAATSILLNAYASPFYGIGTDRLLHASSPPSHFAMQRTAVGVLADNQTFATQLVRTADTARAASPSIPKTFSIERGVRFRSSRPYDPCDDHPLDYRQQEAEDYEWSRMERASFCAGASFRSLGSFVLSGPTGGVQKNTTVCQGSKPRNSVAIALKQEKASSSCCSLASLVTFEALAQDLGTSDETNPSRRPHTVPPRALGRKVSFCEKVMNKSAASVGRSSVRTLEEKENDILRASNPSLLNFWELLTDTAHCSIVSERTTSTVDHAPRLCVQNSCPEYFHQRSSSVGSVCHIDEQPSPSFLETNGGLAHCRFLDQWTKTGLVHVAATGSSAASGSAAAASARLTEV